MDEPVCPGYRDALKRMASSSLRVNPATRKIEEAIRSGERGAGPRRGPLVGTDAIERLPPEIAQVQPVRKFNHPSRYTDCGVPGSSSSETLSAPGAIIDPKIPPCYQALNTYRKPTCERKNP
jgi:hypothetical protein